MVKRTLEVYDCDKCGNEAKRYTLAFEDGTLVMDRCETHARKIEAFRTEEGQWVAPDSGGRNTFRKTSVAELRSQVEAARRRPKAANETGPESGPGDNVRRLGDS